MQGVSFNNIARRNSALITGTLLSFFATAVMASCIMWKQKKELIPPTEEEENLPKDLEVQFFTNRRSQKIRYVTTRAKGDAKAKVFHITGLGEHCTRYGYLYMYKVLSEAGIEIHAMDLHGQGLSEGLPRAYCDKFAHFIDDAEDFIVNGCGNETKKLPIILMGQSLGGLIASHMALRMGMDTIAGLIATSPAYGVDMDVVKKVQLLFSPVLDPLIPTAKLVDAVRSQDLTHDEEEVKRHQADPLIIRGKTPLRTGRVVVEAMDELKKKRKEVTCPCLIIHGALDNITSIDASLDFYKNIGTPKEKRCFLRCPGAKHETLNESVKDILLGEIIKFASSGGTLFHDKHTGSDDGIVDVIA